MATPTKEELIAAVQEASNAGDIGAANEIADYIDQLYPPTPSQIPAEGSLGGQLAQRGASMQETGQQIREGELSMLRGGYRNLGQIAGAGGDIIGAGLETAIDYSRQGLELMGPFNPLDVAGSVAGAASEGVLGDMGNWTLEKWAGWKKDNPELAKDVEATGNIAEFVGPAKLRPPVKTAAGKYGDRLYGAAAQQTVDDRKRFLNEVITPLDTPANNKERLPQMEEVKGGRIVYNNTAEEDEMINVLNKSNVTPKKTLTGNLRLIEGDIEKSAKALDKRLAKSDVVIDKQQIVDSLEAAIEELVETSPTLVGDAGKTAERILGKVRLLLKDSDGSPASILNVRRELDKWIKRQGRDNYDGYENAVGLAQRTIRDTLNLTVAEAVPDAVVRESLKRQHLLFRASDRIAEKAVDEADTRIGRLVQNIARATNSTLPKTPLARVATIGAAAGGIAALGASSWFPLVASGAVLGTLGMYARRGVMSAPAKRALADLLRKTDVALRATKAPEMASTLRADRAFIVELMKLPTAELSPEDEAKDNEVYGGIPMRNFEGS